VIEDEKSLWISRDLWILDVIEVDVIEWGFLVEGKKQKQMPGLVRAHVVEQLLVVSNSILKR
jgi:hypothetical protein